MRESLLIVPAGINGVNATITAKFRLRFLAIVLQLIVVMLRAGARLYANNGGGQITLRLVGVVPRAS
jgi:hypothetical protein